VIRRYVLFGRSLRPALTGWSRQNTSKKET
jgi:hypothetical protein